MAVRFHCGRLSKKSSKNVKFILFVCLFDPGFSLFDSLSINEKASCSNPLCHRMDVIVKWKKGQTPILSSGGLVSLWMINQAHLSFLQLKKEDNVDQTCFVR